MTSWMIRNRNFILGRSGRTKENDPDYVKLDLSIDPLINGFELFSNICASSNLSEGRLLNYLNAYVKLILHVEGNFSRIGFSPEEVFHCLRSTLVHEAAHVRSATLRAVRYSIKTEKHVKIINSLQFPHLISRSLDIVCQNDIERVQAMKLIRRLLLISPNIFDMAIVRSLVSLANGSQEEKDRMLRACLAVLSELAILNPLLFTTSGGVLAIVRNLLECQTPRIAESLCGTLLHLLNNPKTRAMAAVDLKCLAAPYCDFRQRRRTSSCGDKEEIIEERDVRFNCSRLALMSVLRSWPGILHFCDPDDPTRLRAIIDVLYMEHLDAKNAVLDLLYELLGLPQPEWTDEFGVALAAVDPADPQDSWRLGDGFVAAEARALLPHLARTTPDLAEIHLGILLYAFAEAGLPDALAETVASGDTFVCVRATILLGELLHLSHRLLPPDICDTGPPLPGLLRRAPYEHQALAAVGALQDLHTMLKQRPASSSLFLDNILLSSNCFETTRAGRTFVTNRLHKSTRLKQFQLTSKDVENLLRDSAVLQNKDGHAWDWDVIRSILKNTTENINKPDDSNYKTFFKRLIHYFKPSSNRFSHTDLTSIRQVQKYTLVGCDLISSLLVFGEEGIKLLTELYTDISVQIDAITSKKTAHDCLFSPQHMSNTCCQKYFLFVGHATHSSRGIDILSKIGIFEQLLKLSTTTNHDCYVKLIVSSLDYVQDAFPRKILASTLVCEQKSSRLYATQFLLVLLRARVANFDQWGIWLLVRQLFDRAKAVSSTALSILHEACEEKVYLEKLISLMPDLLHLGDKGLLLLIRFLSSNEGYLLLHKSNFIDNEINRWIVDFNYRYVRIIEEELHDCLTLHQRNEDGHYSRRISSLKTATRKEIFVPPHLYGQLVQHPKGFEKLLELGNIISMFQCIERASCNSEEEILELKASLWACGNAATSSYGADLLISNNVFVSTINIAKGCPVFSLRGTAIYVLGLMATTYKGANELFKLGWICTRHDRHERWPVVEGEDWESDSVNSSNKLESESDHASENSTYWNEDSDKPGDRLTPDHEDVFHTVENVHHQKSSTLPHGSNIVTAKHQRSLSESKTMGTLAVERIPTDRLDYRYFISNKLNDPVFRRHRDCSESSTSGVSSCDSVAGKMTIVERIPKLSPIPSSSSLSASGSSVFGRQRHKSEYIRRLSSQSNAYCEIGSASPTDSNRLSHRDLFGYTLLRSLRPDQTNFITESSADELSMLISMEKTKFGYRAMKVRSLDRCQTHRSYIEPDVSSNKILSGSSSSSLTSMSKRMNSLRNDEEKTGPCYMGIAMPRNLREIFPKERVSFRGVFDAINRIKNRTDSISHSSETSKTEDNLMDKPLKTESDFLVHDMDTCFRCCRWANGDDKKLPLFKVFKSNVRKTKEQSVGMSKVLWPEEEVKMKIDILKHVERLSNPVWYKQSRQALLQMKQKHPKLFQDMCLYSEVCKIIGNISVRLMARRFLQELFQDLNFDTIIKETQNMMTDKKMPTNISANLDQINVLQNNVEHSDDFVRIDYFNSDSAQRSAELSGLVRTHGPVDSDGVSSTVIKKKTLVESTPIDIVKKPSISDIDEKENDNQSSIKSSAPIRSPPLASVKEETLSSSENLSEVDRSSGHNENTTVGRIVSPRSQKTSVDSLSLSCSKNKFPITTRYQTASTSSKSYTFSKSFTSVVTSMKSPTENGHNKKYSNSNANEETASGTKKESLEHIPTNNAQLKSESTDRCVPIIKNNRTA